MPKKVEVYQAEIKVQGQKLTVTHIPTATSGSWYAIHDLFEVWAAVAIDLDGTVVGWRNPPDESCRPEIEKAIREAFDIPEPTTDTTEEETDEQ
ncbi:MAG: hypothetical protein JW732_07550 [Dehalococcoidia bacterium]|nr:hypothetical protein [Dehalococcoidia bacterium]